MADDMTKKFAQEDVKVLDSLIEKAGNAFPPKLGQEGLSSRAEEMVSRHLMAMKAANQAQLESPENESDYKKFANAAERNTSDYRAYQAAMNAVVINLKLGEPYDKDAVKDLYQSLKNASDKQLDQLTQQMDSVQGVNSGSVNADVADFAAGVEIRNLAAKAFERHIGNSEKVADLLIGDIVNNIATDQEQLIDMYETVASGDKELRKADLLNDVTSINKMKNGIDAIAEEKLPLNDQEQKALEQLKIKIDTVGQIAEQNLKRYENQTKAVESETNELIDMLEGIRDQDKAGKAVNPESSKATGNNIPQQILDQAVLAAQVKDPESIPPSFAEKPSTRDNSR